MGFNDPEQQPSGDRVSMDTFINKLIIVKPLEFVAAMKTEFKPDGAEAVFANIALLDEYEGEPYKVFKRVLVMQGYLVGAFKNSVGKADPLLGTLVYGERKTGQKAPFKFETLTKNPRAVAKAQEWMDAHADELKESSSFAEPEADGGKPTTLDAMRSNNPWIDEIPF
jgi:hypothetical protein